MKNRILFISTLIIAVFSFVFGTSNIAQASVGFGNQLDWFATGLYPNAWNGGPNVNAYNGQAVNNDFMVQVFNNRDVLTLANNGAEDGYCLADSGNNSGSARAGLVACSTGGVPWGAYITLYSCGQNAYEIKDDHWNAWFGPSGTGNGSAFYLNQSSASCYTFENPY